MSLALVAVLMALDPASTLLARFDSARRPLGVRLTYQGWVKAMRRVGWRVLAVLRPHLRTLVRRAAGDAWMLGGWVPLAVDGTRFDAPRTIANEALGQAGRSGCGPQMLVCLLQHLGTAGTGLIWDWRIGRADAGERGLLRAMFGNLPSNTLLVMDAGFVGFELLSDLHARGVAFLLRVGENATLIKGLGSARSPGLVHLWPQKRRDRPPMALRVIRIGKVWLVTNVLDARRLSRSQAGELYRKRWAVEVLFRTIKQTMHRRKMRSASPVNALLELHWTLVAASILGLLGTTGLRRAGVPIHRLSMARVLEAVRRAASRPARSAGAVLGRGLAHATTDQYQRTHAKASYQWPHKKNEPPPRQPVFRHATYDERRLAASHHS